MTVLVQLLTEHGGMLLLGTTVLLGLGAVAMELCRAPVHRQRLGEFALVATLLWPALALVPLPRPDVSRFASTPRLDQVEPEPTQALVQEPPAVEVRSVPASPLSEPDADSAGSLPRARPLIASSARSADWRSGLALLYLAGAAGCLWWLGIGKLVLINADRVATEPEPWLAAIYASLPFPSKRRRPRLLVSRRCRRPIIYRLWDPRVLLPGELCRPEKALQLRHALRHELAHVLRRDAWGHLLFSVACPLLYFHPLYWWLRCRVQFARELIADDWAARFGGRESYVEQLVQLVKGRRRLIPGVVEVLGVFRFRSQFYRRMKMLLDRRHPLATKPSNTWRFAAVLGWGLTLAATACLVGLPPAGADQDAAPPAVDRTAARQTAEPAAGQESTPSNDVARGTDQTGDEAGVLEVPAAPAQNAADTTRTPGIRLPGVCLLAPIAEFVVSAQVDGRLVEMTAEEGMPVKRGQMLARMDDQQARLELRVAKAELQNLRAEEMVLRQAQIEVTLAKQRFEEVTKLFERKVVSAADLAEHRTALERAKLEVARIEATIDAVRAAGEARLLVAEEKLKRHQIVAEIDGIIVETSRKAGEWVRAGDPICRIINIDRLRVEGFLDARQHDPAEIGGREVIVEIKLARGRIERASGKIAFVSLQLSPDAHCRFWAEIDNRKQNGRWVLLPGLQATVIVKQD